MKYYLFSVILHQVIHRSNLAGVMSNTEPDNNSGVRYEPGETPPPLLSIGLGFQATALILANIVLVSTIVMRAAGETDLYLSWAVWASVIICGLATALQSIRIGGFGAGYFHLMGGAPAFIAISITALAAGGPELLAALVIVSSLVPFIVSARLSLLRQVLTPTISGTVTMLIPVTVMPYVIEMLDDVPQGTSVLPGSVSFFVTVCVIAMVLLTASARVRTWAPIIGIVIGSVVAAMFGIYDYERIAQATWIGFPEIAWRGINLDFGREFWAILPAFIFLALIESLKTIGTTVAVQNVSWRRAKAVDFRSTQSSIAILGVGNLLSGIAGTVPTAVSPWSVALVEATGVAARRIGVVTGAIIIFFAFLPKLIATILSIPSPVIAGYLAILMIMVFIAGIKTVIQDGIDHRKGLIVGSAFWAGIGFQNAVIYPEFFSEFLAGMLQNGVVAGGFLAILLTVFVEFAAPRRSRIKVPFTLDSLPRIADFLGEFTSRSGWGAQMAERLVAVSEETLLTFYHSKKSGDDETDRQVVLVARKDRDAAVLEFVISTFEDNIQDQIAFLGKQVSEESIEQEVSIRMLKHIASSVRHQQFRNTDVLTIRVEAVKRTASGNLI